ncbi:endopeptidase La [Weeksella virosa]|uniref:endopeptidase La n=1 Tax=Weeksella virosa TaxID=1014 RepID=UPI000E03CF69|nr:endopeptidase La [Weeksella virosa]MDK7375546.1 endopeptidase La [Weeksella virosa]MDK7674635.1 endopeptidase La [Weeksella virosa]SUP54731.1 Lon protease 2 [Weeksella virosa]
MEEEIELIPLMNKEEENKLQKQKLPDVLPILPLRNTVLFPGVVAPITAGREKSIQLLVDAFERDGLVGVVTQKDESIEDPAPEDLYHVGTLAKILRMIKLSDGNMTVILQGVKSFRCTNIVEVYPYIVSEVEGIKEKNPNSRNKEFPLIIQSIKDFSFRIINNNPMIPKEATEVIKKIESGRFLINFIASNLSFPTKVKQELLEETDLKMRGLEVLRHMNIELQKLELRSNIHNKVHAVMDQQQKEYFLNQQLRTIQEELGGNTAEEEIDEMRAKAKTKKWTKEVETHFDKELGRLTRLNPQMPEHNIQRNYLEFLLELPWDEYTQDHFDLKNAQKILDRDHYGLDDVKNRIIEHLAVLKLKGDMRSPILCLYGPPGVGKTSLGKSIAEAIGRKYVRMSLGGLHDESEIRGHRKTYIGAMPGRIIQSIKKAGSSNPVFVLDEIDKMSISAHGDPSSAMLEVLDPEQNTSFYDNYLEIGYDISKVFFVATANNIGNIPSPLRDRMEMINISGYTIEEKVEIVKRHLLPKQIEDHGMKKGDVVLSDSIIEYIITGYTRESGVRNLNQTIAKVVRYAAKNIAMEQPYEKQITEDILAEILGPSIVPERYENNETPGVVIGLAWTSVGGDILFIESILSKGKGGLTITGNLGNVMKESATIALEYIKSHAEEYAIDPKIFEQYKVHIHVPEGATPKDGPSAGITMLTSLVSSFTQRKVKPNLAMTGEITLRGKVLPVGGIKEKILAAKRADIKEIILCEDNRKDVQEIKKEYIKGLKFHYVRDMKEVIDLALMKQKAKNAKKLTVE